MKTFQQYLNLKELASYDHDPVHNKKDDMDHKSASSLEVVKQAIKKMMEIKPQEIVAFLNQHRTEPEIRKIQIGRAHV